MKTDQLRDKFLEFFKRNGHVIFPSDNLKPDDESVLFTSAGMNQFKPYFLGEKKDVSLAASCQKCLRTGDLENVGKTAYHHTFFEMLGNFSFGGYFKKEAIKFAWNFVTGELNIKEKDLWVSVYEKDAQAFEIWKDFIGLAPAKIMKFGEKSNFWPANAPSNGPDGPCGPCSEIFFDQGAGFGCGLKSCNPDCDCGRFVEVWNLVFTQFNRKGKDNLLALPQKNIDTGMGLERMAAVLQSKRTNFEIDILAPVVEEVRRIAKKGSYSDESVKSSVNTIVDHARAATFAICDGIFPSNKEQGYVIRKIVKNALFKSSSLGNKEPFLYKLPDVFAELMKKQYPEISQKKNDISKIILAEEKKYFSLLKDGKVYVDVIIGKLEKIGKNTLTADDVFYLYDTYGLPLGLIKEFTREKGFETDDSGFQALLKQQRQRSRSSSMFDDNIFKTADISLKEKTKFSGYDKDSINTNVIKIFVSGQEIGEISRGQEASIVLSETPFYAGGGGQLSDTGYINTKDGEFKVEEVFKVADAFLHKGTVLKGKIKASKAQAAIDKQRRKALARAHTATHLLQAALRTVLGSHVAQQGSLVDEDRFRFDFTHFQALTSQEIQKVQGLVNDYIIAAGTVCKKTLSYEQAKKEGALAFFKDKYSSKVRVVSISDYSKELCAGTHLDNTSEIGMFVIESESSISSGVRRIEALVGRKAYAFFKGLQDNKLEISAALKCNPDNINISLQKLIEETKSLKQDINRLSKETAASVAQKVVESNNKKINGINLLAYIDSKDYLSSSEGETAIRVLADEAKKQLKPVFIFIAAGISGKNKFFCSASDDIIAKGFGCKKFVADFKEELSLKGGGRDNLIQGVIEADTKGFLEKIEACFK
ncbi:MAG: alanine--tRNA ligase, partial [Candidatus Omnitrophota bacterium]